MIELSPAALEAFFSDADEAPILMLNLIKFEPDGGRERYLRYHQMAKPVLARYDVKIIFGGEGLPILTAGPAPGWDAIVLVRYPNRSAFKAMVSDPEYQVAFQVGASAIADIALQPTHYMNDIL
ncbi:DUF1330 domain-containing protein [Aliirhizobium cellulosilyticum]|uniref:Uncharacterized protein (DUF1330 family) n=1 Tax=Aliirhizobium cellulosilyticum TaxID=393664 RepID=A0A7W6SC79_9HYPH|nr:DUF1330 domain-containing protein [Rhizobium cellulosilyticum]MBB4351055.1 uncharacterized protein (DUF1330 family) [Rhizobium cellulosilyticum]MBB4414369.1 uncharacterized protein (DUF1330 family) [Rhizobium cellulosilyticum]MBB4448985.1 uncharacterized protein (DUF1330 family) [Rhizobium cellulosilyticum]